MMIEDGKLILVLIHSLGKPKIYILLRPSCAVQGIH